MRRTVIWVSALTVALTLVGVVAGLWVAYGAPPTAGDRPKISSR